MYLQMRNRHYDPSVKFPELSSRRKVRGRIPNLQTPIPSLQTPIPSLQAQIPSLQTPIPSLQTPELQALRETRGGRIFGRIFRVAGKMCSGRCACEGSRFCHCGGSPTWARKGA